MITFDRRPSAEVVAEVVASGLAGLLLERLPATHAFIRPCYCPECGRHYTDLVLPGDRECRVKHRVCGRCKAGR